jgi:hypothetical protein
MSVSNRVQKVKTNVRNMAKLLHIEYIFYLVVQGEKNVSVHLTITIQKHAKIF